MVLRNSQSKYKIYKHPTFVCYKILIFEANDALIYYRDQSHSCQSSAAQVCKTAQSVEIVTLSQNIFIWKRWGGDRLWSINYSTGKVVETFDIRCSSPLNGGLGELEFSLIGFSYITLYSTLWPLLATSYFSSLP